MGSLPNLHELEEAQRKREKRREYEFLLEQRARDTSRENERLALIEKHRKQSSYNAYLVAGLGRDGISLAATAGATTSSCSGAASNAAGAMNIPVSANMMGTSGVTATTTLSGFTIGGAAILSCSGHAALLGKKLHQHPHSHHRHSLTTRHRVIRTRSSGATHNICDEHVLEHLSSYSPVSTRSHRINPVSSYQVQAALAASRRRESINSSIGATSIRRLITLNNRHCRCKVPAHVRQKVCKNFGCLTLAHGLICAVLLPLIALQASNSLWHHREHWLQIGPNIGSLLLSMCFLISAGMCLPTALLIRRFGYTLIVATNYAALSLFLLCHLYPSIYTLLPAYLVLGLTLSPARVSKTALIVHFGSKLSCSQHECTLTNSSVMDALHDEHKIFCNRDQKVHRLARWFQNAQDLGLILGALIASVIITCTTNDWHCFDNTDVFSIKSTILTNGTTEAGPLRHYYSSYYSGHLDDFYNHNEHSQRICGADMCPISRPGLTARKMSKYLVSVTTIGLNSSLNTSESLKTSRLYAQFINSNLQAGGSMLIYSGIILTAIALGLTIFIGKIQTTFRQDRTKDLLDTLIFAGPMAYFIGTEQAYMLGDFLQAFVSCSLGIGTISGALIGMGIMQFIVSCTLSMLLRHTKRIIVILAGFFFHSCLLLALSSWKPSSDDSALFYVIAASWGACNAMWETLQLALITLNSHTNHVIDVATPLLGLRYLGLGITFAGHGYLCETPKIIALVIILVVSVPPYAVLEIRLESQRKTNLINL